MKTEPNPLAFLSPIVSEMRPYEVPAHPASIDLRLASNEGPLIPEELRRFDDPDGELVRCYSTGRALQAEIAEQLGVEADQVLLTAGGDDALYRAMRVIAAPGREVVLPTPTYEMIERAIQLVGAKPRPVEWWRRGLPVGEMLEAVGPQTAAAVLVTPNNPTGSTASRAEIEQLLEGLGGRLLVVDQAYREFSDEDPTPELIRQPNVLLIRTLSKAFGLAGLRIGVAIGHASVVELMRTVGDPYPVAGPSLAIAYRAIRDTGQWQKRYLSQVREERQQLVGLLGELGQRPMPSEGNFVLSEFDNAAWVADGLAGLGVAVRGFPDRPRLASSLRITCPGSQQGWRKLEASLRTVLAPQALLFDLDGVLADVSQSYRQAIQQTADHFGVPVSPEDIEEAKAAGDANNDWVLAWRLVQRQRPEIAFDAVRERFEALYQGTSEEPGLWQQEEPLVSRRRLQELASRMPLAIVTGRPRRDAERFLANFGLEDLFSTVVTMEDGPAKPDPSPVVEALERLGVERAWMVGDTPDDMQAARAAGVLPVGFAAQRLSPAFEQNLLCSGAARVFTDLTDLVCCLPAAESEGVE